MALRDTWRRLAAAALLAGTGFTAAAETTETIPPGRIRSILSANCASCHGAENPKAGLRLDAPEHLQAGGKSGALFAANDPDASLIVQRISLPEGDEDLMPPKGGPLKSKDIEAIRLWIAQGASFEGWADEYKEPVLMFAALTVGNTQTPALYGEDLLKQLASEVQPAPAEAVEAARKAGIQVAPLDQTTPLLQADLKFVPDGARDEQLALLAPIGANITWLNLAGAQVSDAGLAHLQAMPRLTSLHLERTATTDAGITHLTGLKHLEYLNLFGTQVSDAGLEQLKSLPSLKRLYLWQTGVTPEGAQALASAMPGLSINLGTEQKPLEELVYNDPAEDLKKMEAEKSGAEPDKPAIEIPAEGAFDPFALVQSEG